MFPEYPQIRLGTVVEVYLRTRTFNGQQEIAWIRGKILASDTSGVCLGEDMLHVEYIIPSDMVGYIKVLE